MFNLCRFSLLPVLLSVLLALVCSATAGAAAGYLLKGDVVHDTTSGRQWLQWTETRGYSIHDFNNQVDERLAALHAAGWRVASNEQMAALFNDFFVQGRPTDGQWDADESLQRQSSYRYLDGESQSTAFIALFGKTSHDEVQEARPCPQPDAVSTTQAYFGTDVNGNGLINLATVASSHCALAAPQPDRIGEPGEPAAQQDETEQRARLLADVYPMDTNNQANGLALTRLSP